MSESHSNEWRRRLYETSGKEAGLLSDMELYDAAERLGRALMDERDDRHAELYEAKRKIEALHKAAYDRRTEMDRLVRQRDEARAALAKLDGKPNA